MARSKFALATECPHERTEVIASSEDVAREIDLRREFFLSRLDGPVDQCHLRDLTEMTTNDPAPIYRCENCDVLVRSDSKRTATRFARDHYEEQTLRMLHDLHVTTFTSKTWIPDLLPRGSRVLEIGSYVGGFLEAARRWGWNAMGVDIGRDTAAFTRAKGYAVTTERFERGDFEPASFDGIFIWSCFEQMTNPNEVLTRVRAIAKSGAPLVIEVPDGAVYRDAERSFQKGEPRAATSPIVQQLAYNNLLGFPHHFGYSEAALTRIVSGSGFTLRTLRIVPAIRPLRERLTPMAREEEKRVAPAWIEAVFVTR
jgi:SAM-dependent methyltransferase